MSNLKELKKDFLAQYVMSSEKTKERYKKELDLFFDICNIKTIEDLQNFKNENINLFYEYSKEKKWSAGTTNQRLQTAKLFFSWAFKKKYIDNDFLSDVKRIRTVNEVHYTPSNEDCEKLLTFIKEHTNKQRLYLMTKLLIHSGLRRNEICNLKIDDIDKENSTIKVFGKGKKIVNQPIPSAIMIELIEYINTERAETMLQYKNLGGKDKGFIFVSGIGEKCNKEKKDLTNGNRVDDNVFYQQVKRFASKAGIQNASSISLHSLRRFAGTTIYNETGDIKTACEFLRHSDISTTEKCYIKYDKERLSDTVNSIYNKETNQDKFSENDEYQLFLLLKKKFG